ncbi:hypothetical protein [Actinophytocola sp. NPDC049390]|uniref:hypothetical protein n=1 Tax=Actinophytocola sp. NPDC049390 TaxID=3363894 RepID=UPI00379BECE8
MLSKKLIAKAASVTAGAAIAAVSFGIAPASAAPAEQSGMKFYDDYWTLDECVTVGDWGLDHGKWTVYDCQFSGWDYDLYYDS